MKRYIAPTFTKYDVDASTPICYSYGTIPVGGKSYSFDDTPKSGCLGTGGTSDTFDAASLRGSWSDFEK